MEILVIGNKARIAGYLLKGLTESRLIVDIAANGMNRAHLANKVWYDPILLDVMLPGADGRSMTKMIQQKNDISVLFLMARDDVANRICGFGLGANDYLVKPFVLAGLLVKIRRCLRQSSGRGPEHLSVGDLDIGVPGHKVVRAGVKVELTSQEFALLYLLARRSREVLSHTPITSCVWDVNFDTDTNVVDVVTRCLRTKLDEPLNTKLIHIVQGMGHVPNPHRRK